MFRARSAAVAASEAGPPAWDADALARVRHLHLQARLLTDTLRMGEHRSIRTGQAVEFADHQEYRPGMDVRRIDWRVWGRSDRLMVRRFEVETELPCTIILDLSGDLGTGGPWRGPRPDLTSGKAGFAITLAATLLYFLHRHGEPVGLELIGGAQVRWPSLPVRGGRGHLQRAFLNLASAAPAGRADLEPTLMRVGGRTRRRSFVAVISDGMEEPSRWLPAMSALARRRVDLVFVHLNDPREWRLELPKSVRLFSPEGGPELALDPKSVAADFREIVDAYVSEVKQGIGRWGGRYVNGACDRRLEDTLRDVVVGARLSGGAP